MEWMEAVVWFEAEGLPSQVALDLVCNLFYELGVSGVVTEEREDAGAGPAGGRVVGYLPLDEDFPKNKERLESMASGLLEKNGIKCAISFSLCDDKDWENSWKQHFHPHRVGRGIVIRPTWREYSPSAGETVIDLDPGMAFGTGTHPTTAMCLAMVEKHVSAGCSLLDVGTGSGILMIAAAKLGASVVFGVDNDKVALAVARANLEANGLSPDCYGLVCADGVAAVARRFDIVAANILSEVIAGLADDVYRVISPGGLFICSGIIEQKKDMVLQKLLSCGFSIKESVSSEGWVCMVAQKR